jgi:hypothetical protein
VRAGAPLREGLRRRTSPVVVGFSIVVAVVVVVVIVVSVCVGLSPRLGAQDATSLSAGASRKGSRRARLPVGLAWSSARNPRISTSTSAAEHANTTMHSPTATSSGNSTIRASAPAMNLMQNSPCLLSLSRREASALAQGGRSYAASLSCWCREAAAKGLPSALVHSLGTNTKTLFASPNCFRIRRPILQPAKSCVFSQSATFRTVRRWGLAENT